MKVLLFVSRLIIAGVFVFSGWQKLVVPIENFQASLEAYEIFPDFLIPLVSFTVPWLEFLLGIFLAAGLMVRVVAGVISGFLTVFIFVLARTIILKLPVASCGCFGAGLDLTPVQSLTLDSGLLILSVLILRFSSELFSVDATIKKITKEPEGKDDV